MKMGKVHNFPETHETTIFRRMIRFSASYLCCCVLSFLICTNFFIFLNGSIEEDLFQLALSRYDEALKNLSEREDLPPRIHLLRVPKAGSTSLSIIARRFVGCQPPGPCCKYPGDPPGSCPHQHLFECQLQHKVVGCTGHNPEYDTFLLDSIPTISIVREPISRAISGFFYPNHHNMDCHADLHTCFEAYTKDPRYQNILIKMFTGQPAYNGVSACRAASECEHSLELAIKNLAHFKFMGILELWELSLLVFHTKYPQFIPLKEEFLLYQPTNASSVTATGSSVEQSHRVNRDQGYTEFQKTAPQQYFNQLQEQSQFDIEMYHLLVQRFCKEVKLEHLWEVEKVREYWKAKIQQHKLANIETECTE